MKTYTFVCNKVGELLQNFSTPNHIKKSNVRVDSKLKKIAKFITFVMLLELGKYLKISRIYMSIVVKVTMKLN